MPISRDKKTVHDRRGGPCPLCGEQNSKCATVDDAKGFTLCFRFPDKDPLIENDWVYLGDAEGTWGKWRKKDKTVKPSRPAGPPVKIKPIDYSGTLGSRERGAYQGILNELQLDEIDRADLLGRGLTDSQIDAWGYKTVGKFQQLQVVSTRNLPGVHKRGWNLNTPGDGYLCPIRNPDGQITGMQMRLRNPEKGRGRYCWLSSSTDERPDLGPGLPDYMSDAGTPELPITVCLPDGYQKSGRAAIVEGCGPKPLIAANRVQLPTIGAAGGMWDRSPLQLREYLGSPIIGAGEVVIYPDAGATINHRILARIYETCKLLRDWEIKILVGWWGQDRKGSPDIDEDLSIGGINYLPPGHYWRMIRQYNQARINAACGQLGINSSSIPASHNRITNGILNPTKLAPQDHCRAANDLEDLGGRFQLLTRISRLLPRNKLSWKSEVIREWFAFHGYSAELTPFDIARTRRPYTRELIGLSTNIKGTLADFEASQSEAVANTQPGDKIDDQAIAG